MSTFRSTLVFFDQIGVYDVVLPFLLIFTLVYAMMEKTAVFGNTEDGSKRNLNAMVAFCTAFLFVASSRLVALVNYTIAKAMVLLVIGVLFMIVVGPFSNDKMLSGYWLTIFRWLMFVGLALIVLYNLGWLDAIYYYTTKRVDSALVGSVLLLAVLLGFMWYITSGGSKEEKDKGAKT